MSDPTSTLAVQYVRLIAEQVATMGVSVDRWLGLSGLTRAQLHAPDFAVDYATFRRLSLDAMQLSEEPAFGLLVGERLGVQAHGAVGYAAMSSRTLRALLDLLQRYIGLRIALLGLSVEERPHEVRVALTEHVPLGEVRAMVLEGVVTSLKSVVEDVSMGAQAVQAVAFPFPAPPHAGLAASLLGCPIRYDQDWAGFTLSPHQLDLQLKTSDPEAFRVAETLCRRALDDLEASRSWGARVQRILLEKRIGFPSLDETARRLHVTPRTLHRRLRAEGTAFRPLVEDLRHRIAVDQLLEGRASIEEVAYILGYSDPSNFRRAFRRWTGEAPSHYRAHRTSPRP